MWILFPLLQETSAVPHLAVTSFVMRKTEELNVLKECLNCACNGCCCLYDLSRPGYMNSVLRGQKSSRICLLPGAFTWDVHLVGTKPCWVAALLDPSWVTLVQSFRPHLSMSSFDFFFKCRAFACFIRLQKKLLLSFQTWGVLISWFFVWI